MMQITLRAIAGSILAIWSCVATAQPAPPAAAPSQQQSFGPGELVNTGQRFFGGVSQGFAGVIEKATSQWGLPNGYVLGEEAGGAFIGGLRYGEGCSTPRMPAISKCSGKAQQWATTSAGTAHGP
jgi:hypothetical protein